MAWIKGIVEALKPLEKTLKAEKALKEIRPVVKAPNIFKPTEVARTVKLAARGVKEIKALRVAKGRIPGAVPKAIRTSKGLVAGATAGFVGGAALGYTTSRPSAEEIGGETGGGETVREEKAGGTFSDETTTTSTAPMDQLNSWAAGVLDPLADVPVIGEAVQEAEERGLSFPLLLALAGVGGYTVYWLYKNKIAKKTAKAKAEVKAA